MIRAHADADFENVAAAAVLESREVTEVRLERVPRVSLRGELIASGRALRVDLAARRRVPEVVDVALGGRRGRISGGID